MSFGVIYSLIIILLIRLPGELPWVFRVFVVLGLCESYRGCFGSLLCWVCVRDAVGDSDVCVRVTMGDSDVCVIVTVGDSDVCVRVTVGDSGVCVRVTVGDSGLCCVVFV